MASATVRTEGRQRLSLRARRVRRQGADVRAREGHGMLSARRRSPAGERPVPVRRRGGDRQRIASRVRSAAPCGSCSRRRGRLGYTDAGTHRPAITYSLRGALGARGGRRGTRLRPALRQFRWRGPQSAGGAVCCCGEPPRTIGPHRRPRVLRSRARVSRRERAAMAREGPSDAQLLGDAKAPPGWGEPGYSAYERTTIRPCLVVNGIVGGYQGPGGKAVVPSARSVRRSTSVSFPISDPTEIARPDSRSRGPGTASNRPRGCAHEHGGTTGRDFTGPSDHASRCNGVPARLRRQPTFIRSGGTIPDRQHVCRRRWASRRRSWDSRSPTTPCMRQTSGSSCRTSTAAWRRRSGRWQGSRRCDTAECGHDRRLSLPRRARRRPDRAVGHTCAPPHLPSTRAPASASLTSCSLRRFTWTTRRPIARWRGSSPDGPDRFFGFAFVHAARDRGRIRAMVTEAVEMHRFLGIKVHRYDARITREICDVARAFAIPVLYDVMGEVAVCELLAARVPGRARSSSRTSAASPTTGKRRSPSSTISSDIRTSTPIPPASGDSICWSRR